RNYKRRRRVDRRAARHPVHSKDTVARCFRRTRPFRMANTESQIERAYALARERYAAFGVDAEGALKQLAVVPLSLHCWQGDDVGGFEHAGAELGGGLAVTGNYPGKARTADELRDDLDKALSLLPGTHR